MESGEMKLRDKYDELVKFTKSLCAAGESGEKVDYAEFKALAFLLQEHVKAELAELSKERSLKQTIKAATEAAMIANEGK